MLQLYLVSIKPKIRVRDMYLSYVMVVHANSKAAAKQQAAYDCPHLFDETDGTVASLYCKPKAEKLCVGYAHGV